MSLNPARSYPHAAHKPLRPRHRATRLSRTQAIRVSVTMKTRGIQSAIRTLPEPKFEAGQRFMRGFSQRLNKGTGESFGKKYPECWA